MTIPARRRTGRAATLAALALLALPLLPGHGGVALGHAQLVASSPGAGTVVAEAPAELRLAFSEPLERQVTSLDVTTADGSVVLQRGGEVDPADAFALVAALPDLADGVYVVTWRTLSAADGHTAEGSFSFGVGEGTTLDGAVGGEASHATAAPVDVVTRFLTLAGLLGALGIAAFHRVGLRTGPLPAVAARLLAGALALAGSASLVAAVANAIEAGAAIDYLLGTRNGGLQLARGVTALVAAGLLLVVAPRWRHVTAIGGGLAAITLLIAAGHASALPGPVPILAGVVHASGAAVWLGGVVALALLVVRPGVLLGPEEMPPLSSAVPRFSALALVSIGLVGATGVVIAWWQTGTLIDAGTEYGRTLLMKSGFAAGALALGGLNYLDGGRSLAWLGGFGVRVRVEALAGVAVLAMTAALALTTPTDEARATSIRPVPDAFGETQPGLSLAVTPARPGVNRVAVSTAGAMAGAGIELALALDRLDTGASTRIPLVSDAATGGHAAHGAASDDAEASDGRVGWTADALVLPAGGRWDATVLILASDGAELGRQRFSFAMGATALAGGADRALLEPPTVLAVLLALGGALGIGLGAGGWRLPRCDAHASRLALLAGGAVAVVVGGGIGLERLLIG